LLDKETKKAKKKTTFKTKQKLPSPHEQGVDPNLDIPTTVAASMKRNVTSSQTVIETFLPSQPMNVYSEPGRSTRLSAVWQTPSSTLLLGTNGQDENVTSKLDPSFQMLRMMMKRPFVKGQQAGFVENYVHETIQIGLNLSRGKELMRLGIATLVITGEEEGEIMVHIPVRPVQLHEKDKKGTRSMKKKQKEKDNKTCFENDHRHFSIDENASLYVGVRVHQQHDVEAAALYQEAVTASESELLMAARAAKDTMMNEQAKVLEYQAGALYKARTVSTASSSSAGKKQNPEKMMQRQAQENPKAPETQSQQEQKLQSQCAVPRRPSTTMMPGMQNIFSGLLCGATLNLMPEDEPVARHLQDSQTEESLTAKKSDMSKEITNCDISKSTSSGLPMSEVLNLKNGPEYAKSFFSGVTFSTGAMSASSEDMDLSAVVEQTAKQLALM
jgi:hypothetical protein